MPVAPAHHFVKTYTLSELDALAQEFKIPETQRGELARLLEDAAAIWRWYDAAQRGTGNLAQSRKALVDVSKHARKLSATLRDLPPRPYAALNSEATAAISRLLRSKMDQPRFLGVMVQGQNGEDIPATFDVQDIVDLLEVLADMSDQAGDMSDPTNNLKASPSGKRVDEALRMWIINIDDFWTKSLGRPFVRTLSEKGEAVSEAAHFCVTAFKNVSPETAQSTVLNAMKKHIAAQRKKQLAK